MTSRPEQSATSQPGSPDSASPEALSPDTQALLGTVARRTMAWPFQMWGFGEAIALRGLLAASRALGDPGLAAFVARLLRQYAARRDVGAAPADHVAPGRELVELYQQTGDEPLLNAARRLATLHASFPSNTAGARLHRPDLSGFRRQIWVDCMDNEAPFLVRLGAVTGEAWYIDRGVDEIAAYARLLQDDETGLFQHGYEEPCGRNGQVWARGNGWALMGLVETLRLTPPDHARRAELTARFDRVCAGLARQQHASGLWHTIVDGPDTYLESTLATMIATAVPDAAAAGLIDPDRYREMAARARRAVLTLIDADGALRLVTEATPIAERAMYATRRFGVYPWGQGPLLLMLSDGFGSE